MNASTHHIVDFFCLVLYVFAHELTTHCHRSHSNSMVLKNQSVFVETETCKNNGTL